MRDVMTECVDRFDGLTTLAEALRMREYVDTKSLMGNKRHDDEAGVVLLSAVPSVPRGTAAGGRN